ncbi:MAG: hypothetical protein WA911_12380 [Castellaniella sp.]
MVDKESWCQVRLRDTKSCVYPTRNTPDVVLQKLSQRHAKEAEKMKSKAGQGFADAMIQQIFYF